MTDAFSSLIDQYCSSTGVLLDQQLRSHLRSVMAARLWGEASPQPSWTEVWFRTESQEAALYLADWAAWSLAMWPGSLGGASTSLRQQISLSGYHWAADRFWVAAFIDQHYQFWQTILAGICGAARGSTQLIRTSLDHPDDHIRAASTVRSLPRDALGGAGPGA